MAKVAEHIKKLTQALLSYTRNLGIVAKTPDDSVGPLVVLQSKDSALLVQKLAESGIIASSRHDGLRISFHLYNTMGDVTAVVNLLKENLNLMVLASAGVGSYD